jgi:hypothetical protein
VEAKLNATGKLDWDPSADPKLNKTTAALNAFADKLGANDAEMIDQLNAKLSKYNIEVTGKSVAQPSKFANEAAAIARSITGISLGLTGVEFNPCLISYGVTGVSLGGTGINVAPVGLQTSAVGSLVSVQGANIQPSLILVQPIGANGERAERERGREGETGRWVLYIDRSKRQHLFPLFPPPPPLPPPPLPPPQSSPKASRWPPSSSLSPLWAPTFNPRA